MSDVLDPDLDALARAVDARVLALPEGRDPARLFGVRLKAGDAGVAGFVLVPFWSGAARELSPAVVPPARVVAIALETRGWAAPLGDDGGLATRPSRHPERRRIHQTVLVAGDGADVSVLRYDDDAHEPMLLHGAVGVVPDLLRACWRRRPSSIGRSGPGS